jgi:hypothetical protein
VSTSVPASDAAVRIDQGDRTVQKALDEPAKTLRATNESDVSVIVVVHGAFRLVPA